jgi:outer membrane lipoprotein SlyB
METQARKPLHPLVWAAGFALIVFCGLGAAAIMGWIGTGKAVEQPPIAKLDKARAPERAHVAAKVVCLECGVVQSVHEVDIKGSGSGVGAVGGAVVGGVVGHQVGEGDNRKIGAVVGAVAGGLLGNEIEKQVRTTKTFEIAVRFDDGSNRVITEATESPWRVGDKVKVVNGVIHSNS